MNRTGVFASEKHGSTPCIIHIHKHQTNQRKLENNLTVINSIFLQRLKN